MALYKFGAYFTERSSDAFDKDHPPGATAPYAGIYRCMSCHGLM